MEAEAVRELLADFKTSVTKRLDGIETSLTQVSAAMMKLATMEERMARHMDGMARLGKRLDKAESSIEEGMARLNNLEVEQAKSKVMERIWWVLLTVAVNVVVATAITRALESQL